MSSMVCPVCRSPVRYIFQHQSWWCDRCQRYVLPVSVIPYQPKRGGKLKVAAVILIVLIAVGVLAYGYIMNSLSNIKVYFSDVTDISLNWTSLTVTVHLIIDNPSFLSVEVESGSFGVYLADHFIGYGSVQPVGIAGNGYSYATVVLTIGYLDLGSSAIDVIRQLWNTHSLIVRINGSLSMRCIFVSFTLPFDEQQEI